METFLVILQVLASIAVIAVVLTQSGKESGLSGAIGGGSETYMGKGKATTLDRKLAAATKWIIVAWVVLTLILCLI